MAKTCIECGKGTALNASVPSVCYGCAFKLQICLYCGANSKDGMCDRCAPNRGVVIGNVPAQSAQSGMCDEVRRDYHGYFIRGESVADLQEKLSNV